jgi:hypothetical protein
MWHFYSKSTKIWANMAVMAPVFIMIFASCGGEVNSENRTECLRGMDSLWYSLNEIKGRFGYKINEIDQRRHEMDSVLQWLKFAGENQISPEMRTQIIQYNSVYRIYKGFSPRYRQNVLKAEELFYEIKALDKQVKAGNFDQDLKAFGKEYRRINGSITGLYADVEETLGRLNAVEPTYRRIAESVESFAETLR